MRSERRIAEEEQQSSSPAAAATHRFAMGTPPGPRPHPLARVPGPRFRERAGYPRREAPWVKGGIASLLVVTVSLH
jgi:hypothetical protein